MGFNITSYVENLKAPCYVFSEELFERRVKKVKEAFGEKVNICFSIKANPFLLTMLPEDFSKVEVCSPGELEICKALGLPPEKILFSGLNKSSDEIRTAMDYGAAIITAESRMHFDAISNLASEMKVSPKVLLRLTSDSQFGMDKSELKKIIAERDSYPQVDIVGIHYFSGTQKKGAKAAIKEMELLRNLIAELKDEFGFETKKIEYGAGLSSEYFLTDEEAEEKEMAQLNEVAPYIKSLAEEVEVTVEMGRFFASDCGFYLTNVVDTKVNDDINYAVVDGGAHQLKYDGQLGGMLVPEITVINGSSNKAWSGETLREEGAVEGSNSTKEWTLAGSLCTTQDIIARNAELGDLKPGDILAFHRAGAYSVTEGIAMFLSRDLPRVYGIRKTREAIMFRDRIETFTFNMPR